MISKEPFRSVQTLGACSGGAVKILKFYRFLKLLTLKRWILISPKCLLHRWGIEEAWQKSGIWRDVLRDYGIVWRPFKEHCDCNLLTAVQVGCSVNFLIFCLCRCELRMLLSSWANIMTQYQDLTFKEQNTLDLSELSPNELIMCNQSQTIVFI